MYLVGKEAGGGEAGGPDTHKDARNGAGNNGSANGNGHANGNGNGHAPRNGNGNGNGNHIAVAADLDEVRADAARRAAIELATATLNAADGDTAAHSDDVDVIADGICRKMGITGRERENVIAAARLHDIGKVAIPPQVLEKPGPLNDSEWAIMRRHTLVGQQILIAVPEMEEVASLVRHSHERWDGAGYPDGLSDEEIPLGSRIIACADAYHAVRSDRAYRRGRNAEDALAEIASCAGTQFDPDVTDALQVLVAQTRQQAKPGAGQRTTYRSTRLAALLLALALGVGASAVAHFAGSPLAPKAEASGEPAAPLPALDSSVDLPDLGDLPIFDLARTDRAVDGVERAPVASGPGGKPAQAGERPATPAQEARGGGQDAGTPNGVGPSNPGNGGQDTTGTPAGNSSNEPPASEPPSTPPGQVPGGNPGHGGLPPGNPLAPGHQPVGTPGDGALSPGQGGTPPGQVQKETREATPAPPVAAPPAADPPIPPRRPVTPQPPSRSQAPTSEATTAS